MALRSRTLLIPPFVGGTFWNFYLIVNADTSSTSVTRGAQETGTRGHVSGRVADIDDQGPRDDCPEMSLLQIQLAIDKEAR